MYVRRGVLRDISILKIEAKTVNMYVRKGGPTHNYKIRKGGPRKKYVCKEGGVKKFSCHPPRTFFFGIALKHYMLLYCYCLHSAASVCKFRDCYEHNELGL